MTVPTRAEALALLGALGPPDWLMRHCVAVADIAVLLAERARALGGAVDAQLVESAALLHDVAKALPSDDPLRTLDHGHAGAAWLTERGYGELAAAVAAHPAVRLTEPGYERWASQASLEERIVAYADKRAEARPVTLDQRYAGWLTRHPERRASLELGLTRARRLEREVCAAAGVEPAELGPMNASQP
jgi:putative nucleotidyltransferase with HDIG domain